jgi:hypothetical protein
MIPKNHTIGAHDRIIPAILIIYTVTMEIMMEIMIEITMEIIILRLLLNR